MPPNWILVIILGCLSAFGPLAVDMYLPAFPAIAEDLDTSLGMVQFTLAAFLLGLAIGQIFWGTLSDHVGRRMPLGIGCLLFSGMALLCARTHSIYLLIWARFFMGLGGSVGMVVSRAVVRDMFEEQAAARFYSMMIIVSGIAPIVAPFLGGLLLKSGGWPVIFDVVAGFGLFCSVSVFWGLPETLRPEQRLRGHIMEVFHGYFYILSRATFWRPALMVGCGAGILFTYITDSPYIFINLFGVPVEYFGILFAVNSIGLYVGSQGNRLLLRRFSAEELLSKAIRINILTALLLVACAWTRLGGFPLFFVLLFFNLSCLGVVFPNATALTMQPFAAMAGSASALLGICQFVLGAVGGALAGLYHNGSALPVACQIAGYGLLAGLILWLIPRKRI